MEFRWVIINDLAQAGFIVRNAAQMLGEVIQFNYSRGQHPLPLPVIPGSFF